MGPDRGTDRRLVVLLALLLLGAALGGCNRAKAVRTDFLSDYSQLEKVRGGNERFVSDRIAEYHSYLIEPIQVLRDEKKAVLTRKQRMELATFFDVRLANMLRERGFRLVGDPGDGVARVRIAVTDVRKATWFLNIHPGSKLTGAGAGSAALEAEVVDSLSGEQLAAFIDARTGNQFEIDMFNTLDDVRDVIDAWIAEAARRLDEFIDQRETARGM